MSDYAPEVGNAGELEGGVGAQAVEIVGVFVAAGEGEDARLTRISQRL
jgi:hypothetical protein